MDERTDDPRSTPDAMTASEAQRLLASVPPRPRRRLRAMDHLSALATIALSFAAGALALAGHPWWATLPGLGALVVSHHWVARRQRLANEPRLRAAAMVTVVFTVWLVIPIWRGITRGEVIPFPEAFLFAGLAPLAWLAYYLVLLIRR